MSSPTIYKSIFPPVRIPEESIFSHVLGSASRPNFADNLPAFIDAVSGKVVNRGQLRDQSLKFAYGLVGDGDAQILAKRGGPTFLRGDVIGIYRYVHGRSFNKYCVILGVDPCDTGLIRRRGSFTYPVVTYSSQLL
jgi:hypothetical protein